MQTIRGPRVGPRILNPLLPAGVGNAAARVGEDR